MRRLLVVERNLLVESLWMSKFTPLSHSDFLHRYFKLKSSYVASSLLLSHMKVHEAGIDPVFSAGTVENVSPNTT